MKRLILKQPMDWLEYVEDVNRIVAICEQQGYGISYDDAYHAWEAYSESMAAGWMGLDKDDELVFDRIRPYLLEAY